MTDTKKKSCRGCDTTLSAKNARMWQDRFIGVCRSCEAGEARKRYERENPEAKHYEDSRRKYKLA